MQKSVAFFDIDGTVFRSSLLIELVERLLDSGIFPKEAREEFDELERYWRDREGSYEEQSKWVWPFYRYSVAC